MLVLDVSEGEDVDQYLNRNKRVLSCMDDINFKSIDILIVDGDDASFTRLSHQILANPAT